MIKLGISEKLSLFGTVFLYCALLNEISIFTLLFTPENKQ